MKNLINKLISKIFKKNKSVETKVSNEIVSCKCGCKNVSCKCDKNCNCSDCGCKCDNNCNCKKNTLPKKAAKKSTKQKGKKE